MQSEGLRDLDISSLVPKPLPDFMRLQSGSGLGTRLSNQRALGPSTVRASSFQVSW